jgi:hypothetical protein
MNFFLKLYDIEPFGAITLLAGLLAFGLGVLLFLIPAFRESRSSIEARNAKYTADRKFMFPWAYRAEGNLTNLPRPEIPARETCLMLIGGMFLVISLLIYFPVKG